MRWAALPIGSKPMQMAEGLEIKNQCSFATVQTMGGKHSIYKRLGFYIEF